VNHAAGHVGGVNVEADRRLVWAVAQAQMTARKRSKRDNIVFILSTAFRLPVINGFRVACVYRIE